MAKATKSMARARAVKPSKGAAAPAHMALARTPVGMSAQDTLVNLMTGMGTEKDKLAGTIFGYGELPKQQLDAAYRGDWISRKVVDIPAFDAFREWRAWQADPNDITKIEETEHAMKIQRKSMLASMRGRLYGGGALIMGVDQGVSSDELIIDNIQAGQLKFVHAVSKWELSAGPINWDVMSPYFGEPQYYTKQGSVGGSALQIHPSRVVRFLGAESLDPTTSNGWGDSVLQICADAILACGTVAGSIAQLIAEAKIDIVKVPELSEKITNATYEARLKKRFGIANSMKSVFGMLIVDAEEEWDRIQQNFASMPELLQMYLLITCGAADIPATRFLGQSPTGLSATGESDTRNYYDRVSTEQNVVISPAMERLDRVIIRSALGDEPDGIFYEWNPLWQMDEAQKADIAVKKSQVMTADANAALITPLVLQKARENQLIEDGTYPGIEQIIEEFGDNIDEREPEPGNEALLGPDGEPVDLNDPEAVAAAVAAKAAATQSGAKGAAANENAPPAAQTKRAAAGAAVGDGVAARLRKGAGKKKPSRTSRARDASLVDASTPRTLYIHREVINQAEIKAWAKSKGFGSSLDDMHVTVMYSKVPVDWLEVGADEWPRLNEKGQLVIRAGGPRVMERFGKAIVLAFANTDLAYRHEEIRRRTGAEWEFEDYTPHVTITYNAPSFDLLHMEAYQGEIVLGPEIFEEIKPNSSGDPEES